MTADGFAGSACSWTAPWLDTGCRAAAAEQQWQDADTTEDGADGVLSRRQQHQLTCAPVAVAGGSHADMHMLSAYLLLCRHLCRSLSQGLAHVVRALDPLQSKHPARLSTSSAVASSLRFLSRCHGMHSSCRRRERRCEGGGRRLVLEKSLGASGRCMGEQVREASPCLLCVYLPGDMRGSCYCKSAACAVADVVRLAFV